jgi:hypothetical protein
MTNFWLAFLAVQFVGLLCSAAMELFHPGLARAVCNVIALLMLEPGLILARAVIDKFYWERFTTEELFTYASIFGFLLNALFAIWLHAFVRELRPQRNN